MKLQPIAERILEEGRARNTPSIRPERRESGRRVDHGRRSSGRIFLAGVLAALVIGGGVAALVATGVGERIVTFATGLVDSASADNGTPDSENIFVEHAQRAGLTHCSRLFTGLGAALVGNGTHSAMTRWDETGPNDHAVHALVGMDFGGSGQEITAGGVIFAAPVGSGCEGSLTRVVPSAAPCDQLGAQLPQGSTAAANLAGTTVYNLPDGGSAMLVPSAAGCVLVTTVSVRN